MAQDIPFLDSEVEKLPEDMRESLADMGRTNLMFFAKGVLGYRDMTQQCHGPLCAFMDLNTKRFKKMLMPRDTFKSTVITVGGNLQKAMKNPEERILIANESATNSERFLGSIKSHLESNRVLRALYSDVIPKDTRKVRWNNSELELKRESHAPEPTFDTIGMTGSVTSRHYTHIDFDDPISEEAVKSEKVMQDTINRISAVTSLLENGIRDSVWIVGTRWAFWDIYKWWDQNYGVITGQFARSIVEDGQIIFPERFNEELLSIKRKAMGPYKYSCLMMNNPRNADVQDLNVDDIRWFRYTNDGASVELLDGDGALVDRWNLDQLDITVTVDPAPAETIHSDRNAVVCCGITPRNQVIVLDAWARRCTPYDVIQQLFWLHDRFRPRVYGIEGVAYQKVLKYVVARESQRTDRYLRVEELRAPGKGKIHVRGLQPVMALHKLYMLPSQLLLIQEMDEFPLGEHDDCVDALGLQQQLWKGRLSPEHLEKVEAEARKMASRISGYGLRNDPGPSDEIRRLMRDEMADEEIEREVDWDEVPITH